MMDERKLIYLDDAIDAVKEWHDVFDEDTDLIDTIKNLPSAQPEQRWIPCSERLPNSNGIYNVTRKISDGFEYLNIVDTCYFDGTNIWHDDTRINHDRKYLTDIVAWMLLPEPYKGEENGDD